VNWMRVELNDRILLFWWSSIESNDSESFDKPSNSLQCKEDVMESNQSIHSVRFVCQSLLLHHLSINYVSMLNDIYVHLHNHLPSHMWLYNL
jgi:hypothetical protein